MPAFLRTAEMFNRLLMSPLKGNGSSLYRVGEAAAMLSLCLCFSVVLLEMLAIIIPAITESNHIGTEAQSKKGRDEIKS